MNGEALGWLRQQIEARLKAAREAGTGDRWEADRHYDALWVVDFKPSAGPVDLELLPDACIHIADAAPYEDPRFASMFAPLARHVALNDPQDTIARCEAELAILREHHILWATSDDEDYADFSVVRIGGADLDHGCIRCHYYGMGGVKGYGACQTVRLLAGGYQHWPGYTDHWAASRG